MILDLNRHVRSKVGGGRCACGAREDQLLKRLCSKQNYHATGSAVCASLAVLVVENDLMLSLRLHPY